MHPSSLAFSMSVAAILAAAIVPLACAQGTGSELSAGANVGGAGGATSSSSSSAGGQGGTPSVGPGGGSAGTGPSSPCDGTGDCGGCQTCAQTTALCSDLYNQCMNSHPCTIVVSCWGSCGGDPSCEQYCLQSDQQGATLFEQLASCAVCACVSDCSIDPAECM